MNAINNSGHTTWERAMHAWQTGNYQTSFTLLQKLSAKDDGHNHDSQEYLALHYLNSQGTAQSYHKGLYWMERAILQGDDVYPDYFRALQDSIKRIEKTSAKYHRKRLSCLTPNNILHSLPWYRNGHYKTMPTANI